MLFNLCRRSARQSLVRSLADAVQVLSERPSAPSTPTNFASIGLICSPFSGGHPTYPSDRCRPDVAALQALRPMSRRTTKSPIRWRFAPLNPRSARARHQGRRMPLKPSRLTHPQAGWVHPVTFALARMRSSASGGRRFIRCASQSSAGTVPASFKCCRFRQNPMLNE